MIRNITKEFAHFLKEEKAYSNFISNVKRTNAKITKDFEGCPYTFFSWDKTPQGYKYWHAIYSSFFLKIQAEMLSKAYKN